MAGREIRFSGPFFFYVVKSMQTVGGNGAQHTVDKREKGAYNINTVIKVLKTRLQKTLAERHDALVGKNPFEPV